MDADRPILFTCADRRGFEVVMYHDRWYDHVMEIHGELAGREAQVQRTIETPDQIRRDRRFPNRACYYRLGDLPPPMRHRHVKVVVEFEDTPNGVGGVVITAFIADQVDLQEPHIW